MKKDMLDRGGEVVTRPQEKLANRLLFNGQMPRSNWPAATLQGKSCLSQLARTSIAISECEYKLRPKWATIVVPQTSS